MSGSMHKQYMQPSMHRTVRDNVPYHIIW